MTLAPPLLVYITRDKQDFVTKVHMLGSCPLAVPNIEGPSQPEAALSVTIISFGAVFGT